MRRPSLSYHLLHPKIPFAKRCIIALVVEEAPPELMRLTVSVFEFCKELARNPVLERLIRLASSVRISLDVVLVIHPGDHLLLAGHAVRVWLLALWPACTRALEANVAHPHWLLGEQLVPHFDFALKLICAPVVMHVLVAG